jgi:hypothetical protein
MREQLDAYEPISIGLFVTQNGPTGAAPAGKAGRYAARRLRHRCFQGDVLKTYPLFGTARGTDSFATDARAFLVTAHPLGCEASFR